MWTEGSFSFNQVKIIVIASALDFDASLSHITSSYWIPSFAFSVLLGELIESLPSNSSMFLVTQVSGETSWLTNLPSKFQFPPTLLTSTLTSLNRAGLQELSEQPHIRIASQDPQETLPAEQNSPLQSISCCFRLSAQDSVRLWIFSSSPISSQA